MPRPTCAALLAALAVTLLASAPALAQVYRWVDDKGEVHYTDNQASIPADKKKAAVKTEGGDLGYVSGGSADAAKPPKAPRKAEGKAETGAQDGGGDGQAATPVIDDDAKERAAEADESRLEQEWRGRFREAHERIQRLERMLAADKKAVEDPLNSGIPMMRPDYRGVVFPNPEFDAIKKRIPTEEKEVAKAKEDLADLDREASRNSVPQHWRR